MLLPNQATVDWFDAEIDTEIDVLAAKVTGNEDVCELVARIKFLL